jgi:hypothetical protein
MQDYVKYGPEEKAKLEALIKESLSFSFWGGVAVGAVGSMLAGLALLLLRG